MRRKNTSGAVIYDVLYGFIPVTSWEEQILSAPVFQRLRWIKQLGFSNYIFPGAEHNRFAHVIGVMHSMHQMIQSLGIDVPDHELFDPRSRSEAAILHKSLRISALLHDLGTFPFSHAIENAYIRHGNQTRSTRKALGGRTKNQKDLQNNHEHLGAFIIKNTRYPSGITEILENAGLDPQMISMIIKGASPYPIANQLMHSDLDADRMDYLLRDAHYTGLKYGQFDRDYLISNLSTFTLPDGGLGFGVKESAQHSVEDFLIARFSWYSQVIRNPGSAKFDILSTYVAKAMLENDHLHQFADLLSMVENQDERFFWWNDMYFMSKLQEVRFKKLIKDPVTNEMIQMLLYREPPKTIRHPAFEHRIIPEGETERAKHTRTVLNKFEEMQSVLKKYGTGREWILLDLPAKDVSFTKGSQSLKAKLAKTSPHLHASLATESIKIVDRHLRPHLLAKRENSLMKHLSNVVNFVPNTYGNRLAYELLKKRRIIE